MATSDQALTMWLSGLGIFLRWAPIISICKRENGRLKNLVWNNWTCKWWSRPRTQFCLPLAHCADSLSVTASLGHLWRRQWERYGHRIDPIARCGEPVAAAVCNVGVEQEFGSLWADHSWWQKYGHPQQRLGEKPAGEGQAWVTQGKGQIRSMVLLGQWDFFNDIRLWKELKCLCWCRDKAGYIGMATLQMKIVCNKRQVLLERCK